MDRKIGVEENGRGGSRMGANVKVLGRGVLAWQKRAPTGAERAVFSGSFGAGATTQKRQLSLSHSKGEGTVMMRG